MKKFVSICLAMLCMMTALSCYAETETEIESIMPIEGLHWGDSKEQAEAAIGVKLTNPNESEGMTLYMTESLVNGNIIMCGFAAEKLVGVIMYNRVAFGTDASEQATAMYEELQAKYGPAVATDTSYVWSIPNGESVGMTMMTLSGMDFIVLMYSAPNS